ncbi:hypothetical protein [Nocardioides bizhenqiangii]|uniref:Branched-chain amino acid ABC transporter permease n=1 Tax=Nocardioides bizhenqiangii TaxID=3095076 RepID=A0ABZ0ZNL6_9ACTN|nr:MULTISPECIES: hypothetical protein [unclassified Nocardioides]MDZ5621009.1 hypothetical protein [Nocardioides sp. HM23]WQQ25366.1 hypothetical protein SHK19_15515 [Nocardioides sp. HM61]
MDQTLAVGLSQGAVYASLAMGFVIGYLATLSINIAHGVFAVLAIFVAASPVPSLGVFWAMVIAILVTAPCDVVSSIERPTRHQSQLAPIGHPPSARWCR